MGPLVCTHCLGSPDGCDFCVKGFQQCETPGCNFDAMLTKNGEKLCLLCVREMEKKHGAR